MATEPSARTYSGCDSTGGSSNFVQLGSHGCAGCPTPPSVKLKPSLATFEFSCHRFDKFRARCDVDSMCEGQVLVGCGVWIRRCLCSSGADPITAGGVLGSDDDDAADGGNVDNERLAPGRPYETGQDGAIRSRIIASVSGRVLSGSKALEAHTRSAGSADRPPAGTSEISVTGESF